MSTKNLPGGKERLAHRAVNLTAICATMAKQKHFIQFQKLCHIRMGQVEGQHNDWTAVLKAVDFKV
jgi:hypothetical protein